MSTTYTLEAEDALHRAVLASRLQLTLRGHTAQVWKVAFSPDGTRIATASADGTAKIWDADSGKELLTLTGHSDSVNDVAFSSDGQHLATASSDNTAKVWDVATGNELLSLTSHTGDVLGLAFSPDGTRLATASVDRTAKVWDAATGRELLTLTGHADSVSDVAFGPDGKRLVTSSLDATAKVWDAVTGEELLTLFGELSSPAFSPDGKRLVVASERGGASAKILDAVTGEELLTFSGHTNLIFGLALSRDGTRLATGSLDRTAIMWDTATGQKLFTLSGHTGAVNGVAFSSDGTRLATASWDGAARVWNISLSQELLTLPTPPRGSGRVAFSSDGARLTTGLVDGTAKVWEVATGKELLTVRAHNAPVESVAFSPDGTRLVTASDDSTAKVWDASTGKELLALLGHVGPVNSATFSSDGTRLATASDDWTVKVWDAATGRQLLSLSFPPQLYAVAFSPDGTRIAAASQGGAAKVWNATTGEEQLTLRGHTDTVWGVAFSPDKKRIATASRDGTTKLWDAATGNELFTLSGHSSTVVAVAFSSDGKRLATASRDGTAKIWDASTGQELLTLSGDDGFGLNGVAFSPNGTRLATGGDNAVRLYALRIEDLVTLAQSRVMRLLTTEECLKYLHSEQAACAPVAQARAIPTQPLAAQGRVCQVTDIGGSVDDKSFNQQAHEGIQNAVEKFGWEGPVLRSREYIDFEKNIAAFLRSDCDLIVTLTFSMGDPTRAAAEANPNQKFIILDFAYDPPLDNVWAQVHATNQAAFLAGYVAASTTKTGKVGTVGGINIPTVLDFMDGFALGVDYYNEKNGTDVEVLGWDVAKRDGLFVGDFCCADEGQRLAEQLMDNGADIIMPVAGPAVGLGAIDAVQKRGNVYFIGVDTDWAESAPEYADIVLTSVEKRFDVSVFAAVKAMVDDTFTGGTHVGTLENGGVDIAPFHDLDAVVSPKVKADLEQITADIIAGKIKTKP